MEAMIHNTPEDPGPKRSPEAVERELARAERLAELWDSAFEIPVLGTRVGLDAIIGLVPGLGDLAGLLPAIAHQVSAKRLGVPRRKRAWMAARSLFDVLLGAIPLVGDIADLLVRANLKNAATLRRHVERNS